MPIMTTTSRWAPLDASLAGQLGDARRQLHHAAQFAAAVGISYLPHAADDSHTNLEWLAAHRALASHTVSSMSGNVRLGVRVADLTLLVIEDDVALGAHELRG